MKGHNENAVRLAALAGDAQVALDRVAKGETDAIDGWLAYGTALNEGRSLFPGDREFGEWIRSSDLLLGENDKMERAAAMWAAANRDQFEEARAAGKARTVRGIHDKWKAIEAEREKARMKAEKEAEDSRKRAEAEAARKEAEEKAKAEEEARVAAAAAETDDERQEAEAKVADAAEATAEAEKVAAEAEAEVEPEPTHEPAEEPEAAKLRKEYRKLTPEAQEDDWIGLRLSYADAKRTIADQKAEIAALREDLAAFKQEDMGRALGNAQRRCHAAEGRMNEYQATAKRLDRQVKALEAENKRLKQEIANQEIVL